VVPATNETDVLADKSAKADTEPQDKPETEGPAEAGAEEDDDGEPPVDAGNSRLRKQISRLLKQRHELRETVEQYAALRPAAEIGEQMQEFAKVNNLSGEDVARVMQLAAMMRHGDYAGFYKAVAPFVRTAQEYLGIALPRDLRERVQAGHMSEDAAKEFARTRMVSRCGSGRRLCRAASSMIRKTVLLVQSPPSSASWPRTTPTTRQKQPPFGGQRKPCC